MMAINRRCRFWNKGPYEKSIRKLYEDSKGRLWALLNNGLYVYDREQDNFVNPLWKKYTNAVQEDAQEVFGYLWDTLVRYNPVTKK